jgi:hypothetical protein
MFAGGQAHSTHPATGALHDPSRISTAKAHREISRGKSGVPSGAADSFGHDKAAIIGARFGVAAQQQAWMSLGPMRAPKSSVCFERHILIEKLTGW